MIDGKLNQFGAAGGAWPRLRLLAVIMQATMRFSPLPDRRNRTWS